MAKRKRTQYKQSSYSSSSSHQTEEELYRKLFLTVIAIAVVLGLTFVSFKFLGPKIGSFFGLISTHRNDDNSSDRIAPPAPIFSNAPEATNKDSINLNGITEPGATVILYVNGPVAQETTSDQGGLFTFANIKLNKGRNTIFAKATDSSQNESAKSQTLTVVFDTEEPEITILEPKNGERIENLQNRITVVGETNEKASVTVNGRRAIQKPENGFELLLGVEEGGVEIKVEATDEAGNKATETIFVEFANN